MCFRELNETLTGQQRISFVNVRVNVLEADGVAHFEGIEVVYKQDRHEHRSQHHGFADALALAERESQRWNQ